MDLMEYQGKELFRGHGIPTTPRGEVADNAEQAKAVAERFGVPVMVKAQVLIGGRGKAGGVKYCPDAGSAAEAAQFILGLDIRGHVVGLVLVEPASEIAEEYYLSVLHDRVAKGYTVIVSVEGGMEIEQVNREHPEKVIKVDLDPTKDFAREEAAAIIDRAALPETARDQATDLLVQLYKGFRETDATLVEVNPLILTPDERVIALDAKISIDNNALFRHPDLAEMDASSADNHLEHQARQAGLQYLKLDGDVGVLGNGAGLVMSTLDVVAQAGGSAADFLDVGGGADADKMTAALSLVLSDAQVRSVLVNIFGGITRCDEVARGVLAALERLGAVEQKLVVRLDGTNAEEGRRILADAEHPAIVTADTMLEGAERAVELAKQSR